MVRLYSYSSELLTFVEAKWVITKFAIGGILIGTIILFGVIELNQSVANALGSRSGNTLATENDILRRQLSLISPRVSELEMQARELDERVNKLHALLQRPKNVRDTVWRFTNATKGSKPQSLISAATSFRP